VTFEGRDIAELSLLPMKALGRILEPYAKGKAPRLASLRREHPEIAIVTERIAADILGRLEVLLDLGLGYLALDRSTPTLSPGELQRLRLATQVHSNLFGVVYVLDEPSAGLHPADTEALLRALARLKAAGNSIFVVEHELEIIRKADWIVDVGPAAGQHGGQILYSGPLKGLAQVDASQTRRHLFHTNHPAPRAPRPVKGWLQLVGVTRNNLNGVNVDLLLGVLTSVTGISGSGKSSLVSQVLVELVTAALGLDPVATDDEGEELERSEVQTQGGEIKGGLGGIKRLVRVDQKPIGRTPRSNLATYTGLFDPIRKIYAHTPLAKSRRYDAGRFSFNVAKGRCENCEGEGFVMVELLFLPSVYAPCPICHGARYNAKTLEVKYRDQSIADVLNMTVDRAAEFFADDPAVHRPLEILREVGLGYLRLGQPATELSGGEAQRIKLASELQRATRGATLYVLDEPTTGLHPSDVERLLIQLDRLVDAGHTVITVEHDMDVIRRSDWIIDMGPGAGDEGGKVIAQGKPEAVAAVQGSFTAKYLRTWGNS
jgi:excinuclease ABC subunit A